MIANWFRTLNPTKRAEADQRLRTPGRLDRLVWYLRTFILVLPVSKDTYKVLKMEAVRSFEPRVTIPKIGMRSSAQCYCVNVSCVPL
jgi:hypothetical protein